LVEVIFLAIKNISVGYFEFSRAEKVIFYKKSRNLVAEVWLHLELKLRSIPSDPDFDSKIKALQTRLTSDILPGFSGVLRKMDGKSKFKPFHETEPSRNTYHE
jgi:hypothetical protein